MGATGSVAGVEAETEANGAANRFKCPRWMTFYKAKVARERVEMFDVLQEALSLRESDAPLGDALRIVGKGGKERLVPVLPAAPRKCTECTEGRTCQRSEG